MQQDVIGQHSADPFVWLVLHGDNVEGVDIGWRRGSPGVGRAGSDALPRAVELLQHGEFRSAAAGLSKDRGKLRRSR